MSAAPRRGVTRGYVAGLLCAAVVVAAALLVAAWGGLALATGHEPVTTDGVPTWLAPLVVLVALIGLGGTLWATALTLLRGRRAPAWGAILSAGVGAYLWWCVAGMLGGMSIGETWTSGFAMLLAPIWAASALLFWGVLARRVYTDRPAPRWPWERAEEDE